MLILLLILCCSKNVKEIDRSIDNNLERYLKDLIDCNNKLLLNVNDIKRSLCNASNNKQDISSIETELYSKIKELEDYIENLYNKNSEELKEIFKKCSRKDEIEKLDSIDNLVDKLDLLYVKNLIISSETLLYKLFIVAYNDLRTTYSSSDLDILYKETLSEFRDKEKEKKKIILEQLKERIKAQGIDKRDMIKFSLNNYFKMKVEIFKESNSKIMNLKTK